jgi:hypothetical protein
MDIYEVIDIGNSWDDAIEISVGRGRGPGLAAQSYAELEPDEFSVDVWPIRIVIVRKKGETQHKAFQVECEIVIHSSSCECTEDVEMDTHGNFKRIE